jgi:hypothetical protein
MEQNKIEILLEKYFEGTTSIDEENELRGYFSSADVAPHLEHYKTIFGYFSVEATQKLGLEISLESKKQKGVWLSIAASVVVLLGVGMYVFNQFDTADKKEKQELGTYDDPKVALRETEKALKLLSSNVNVGIESVNYIQEYQNSKELIFKE